MSTIDRAAEIRQGEELNNDAVEAFLKKEMPHLKGNMEVKQFPGGFSNLTYLLAFDNEEMILRRPPAGKKAKTAHDMSREYRVLSALCPVFPYCPKPLLFCEDEEITGGQFYCMERLKGVILRKDLPEGMEMDKEKARSLSENLIKIMSDLHSLDYEKAGLKDFGKPEGYVKRQVEGWSRRYRDARTEDAPDFEKVMAWLQDTMPADSPFPGIIHNDYKFDNAVLDPADITRITGILDWEMATVGDPLMDLGSSLAYWVEENDPPELQAIRQMPTNIPGMLTRREQVDYYAKLRGMEIGSFDFYYCFGLFRLAGIAQQIYYRYFHGQTKDKRFALLIHAVRILESTALKIIEK